MGRDGTSDYGKDRTECDAARAPRGCTLPKNLSSDVVRAHCVSRFLCRYVRTTRMLPRYANTQIDPSPANAGARFSQRGGI
jgi:hypothetical protein